MQAHSTSGDPAARRHRPKTLTVFAAAFAAGAVLAYGVDRVVDVHVVQVEPQVESEPIFVALRSMPQGAPLTVWDVALKDWPKAMLPTTALKADASLEGMVLRHPIREGQPLLSVQLARDTAGLPMAGFAALPPSVGAAGVGVTPPLRAIAPAEGQPAPAATEQFVPATPAAAPVAAAQPSVAVDVAAAAADPRPAAEDSVAVPTLAVTGSDIDPRDPATPVPSVVAPEAVAVPTEVAAAEPVTVAVEATPTLAATVEPAAAEPTVAPPLAAPVPALPTTDIERSLASVGRAGESQPVATVSVLDRTNRAPAPQAQQGSPRYHLVVPERVALAADASFAQRPAAPAQPNPGPSQAAAATARAGSRRAKPTSTSAPRQERPSPAVRKAAPNTRQSAVGKPAQTKPSVTKPTGTKPTGTKPTFTKPTFTKPNATKPSTEKPAAEAQSSRPLGLGAWFPQFSGGNRQR